MPARPGRDEKGGELTDKGLCLVVLWRPHNLAGPGDNLVETRQHKMPFGDHLHTAPVILHHLMRRRGQPAETTAGKDGFLGGVTQLVDIVIRKTRRAFHGNPGNMRRQLFWCHALHHGSLMGFPERHPVATSYHKLPMRERDRVHTSRHHG